MVVLQSLSGDSYHWFYRLLRWNNLRLPQKVCYVAMWWYIIDIMIIYATIQLLFWDIVSHFLNFLKIYINILNNYKVTWSSRYDAVFELFLYLSSLHLHISFLIINKCWMLKYLFILIYLYCLYYFTLSSCRPHLFLTLWSYLGSNLYYTLYYFNN